jgi:hypothetical protein
VHEPSTPLPAVTPLEILLIPEESETRGLVTFSTGGLRFGIPLESSDRALRMVAISPLPGAPPFLIGTVNVHGELVAVADVCRASPRRPTDPRRTCSWHGPPGAAWPSPPRRSRE